MKAEESSGEGNGAGAVKPRAKAFPGTTKYPSSLAACLTGWSGLGSSASPSRPQWAGVCKSGGIQEHGTFGPDGVAIVAQLDEYALCGIHAETF